ncbi:hypothetical protein QE418_002964 [Microbacterium testaceum]|nr:hypothetical protein [Microbacterium testaceum]MDQ1113516.1 hypothetical protein [Microbacterium testaceum]
MAISSRARSSSPCREMQEGAFAQDVLGGAAVVGIDRDGDGGLVDHMFDRRRGAKPSESRPSAKIRLGCVPGSVQVVPPLHVLTVQHQGLAEVDEVAAAHLGRDRAGQRSLRELDRLEVIAAAGELDGRGEQSLAVRLGLDEARVPQVGGRVCTLVLLRRSDMESTTFFRRQCRVVAQPAGRVGDAGQLVVHRDETVVDERLEVDAALLGDESQPVIAEDGADRQQIEQRGHSRVIGGTPFPSTTCAVVCQAQGERKGLVAGGLSRRQPHMDDRARVARRDLRDRVEDGRGGARSEDRPGEVDGLVERQPPDPRMRHTREVVAAAGLAGGGEDGESRPVQAGEHEGQHDDARIVHLIEVVDDEDGWFVVDEMQSPVQLLGEQVLRPVATSSQQTIDGGPPCAAESRGSG